MAINDINDNSYKAISEYYKVDSMDLERDVLKTLLLDNEQDRIDNLLRLRDSGITEFDFTVDNRQKIFRLIFDHFNEHNEALSATSLKKILIKRIPKKDELSDTELKVKKAEINTYLNKILKRKADKSYAPYAYREMITRQTKSYITNIIESYTEDLKQHIYNEEKGLEKKSNEGTERKSYDEILETFSDRLNKQYKIYNNEYVDEDAKEFNFCDVNLDINKEKKQDTLRKKYITTGFKIYDDLMGGGFKSGETIMISGRPGDGKSILLINNMAFAAFESGKNVLIFTKELNNDSVKRRMYSRFTGIDYPKFKDMNNLNEEESEFFISRKQELHEKGGSIIGIDITATKATVSDIEYSIKRNEKKYKRKVDIVFIDPIYLLNLEKDATKEEKDDRVGALCIKVNALAEKLQIPIVFASQVNREGGRKHQNGQKANSMDAAFSDKLAYTCDYMFMLTNIGDKAKLNVVKHRDAFLPDLILNKRFDKMRFELREFDNDNNFIIKHFNEHKEDIQI